MKKGTNSNILTRRHLESWQSLEDMHKIIQLFCDPEVFTDQDVHRRIGIAKDMLEEFVPLYRLAAYLRASRARLTPEGSQGPDAIIEFSHGRRISAQITVADQSYQEAMNRELLAKGRIVFPFTKKDRDPRTRHITESGHMLQSKEGMLREKVNRVIGAIRAKIAKFYAGTDCLLVSTGRFCSASDSGYSWRGDLVDQVNELTNIPYDHIYLVHGMDVIQIDSSEDCG